MLSDREIEGVNQLLAQFSSMSLSDLERAGLLERFDRKFLLHESKLLKLLTQLLPHYSVLDIDGLRMFLYETSYLDTEDFRYYYQHHNGRGGRQKFRIRTYADYALHFLEVKQKSGSGSTNKFRLQVQNNQWPPTPSDAAFFAAYGGEPSELMPTLTTCYRRISLCSADDSERITIDVNLSVIGNNFQRNFEPVVIAEVKQHKPEQTPAIEILKTLRSHEESMSKYCLSACKVFPELKKNNFKPNLLLLRKLAS